MALDVNEGLIYVKTDRTVRSIGSTERELRGNAVNSDLLDAKTSVPAEASDSAKRRQIMDGAREVFLSHGFDAASMGEIARKAGVSKGTLYVYFNGKEQLFEAIATRHARRRPKGCFRSIRPTMTSKRCSPGWAAAS